MNEQTTAGTFWSRNNRTCCNHCGNPIISREAELLAALEACADYMRANVGGLQPEERAARAAIAKAKGQA